MKKKMEKDKIPPIEVADKEAMQQVNAHINRMLTDDLYRIQNLR
jgi:hypothetical protein